MHCVQKYRMDPLSTVSKKQKQKTKQKQTQKQNKKKQKKCSVISQTRLFSVSILHDFEWT